MPLGKTPFAPAGDCFPDIFASMPNVFSWRPPNPEVRQPHLRIAVPGLRLTISKLNSNLAGAQEGSLYCLQNDSLSGIRLTAFISTITGADGEPWRG
jgi:hypothetical protein